MGMTYRSKGEFETLQSRLDDYRQENERQQARIAALEAELAAKGWRPVKSSFVPVPSGLFEDLMQVASWFQSTCNSMINGETIQNHPDLDAFYYLRNEGVAILECAQMWQSTLSPATPQDAE